MAVGLVWKKVTFKLLKPDYPPQLEIKSPLFDDVVAQAVIIKGGDSVWCFDLTHKQTGFKRHVHIPYTRSTDLIEVMLVQKLGGFLYDIERGKVK